MLWKEVTPEREEEIIEKAAQAIVKYDMEAPGLLFLASMTPVSFFGSQMGLMLLGPYLPDKGHEYLLVFEKRKNVEKLINRVKELKSLKEKEKPKELGLFERFKRKITD